MNKIDKDRKKNLIKQKINKIEQLIEARLPGGSLHSNTVSHTKQLEKQYGIIKDRTEYDKLIIRRKINKIKLHIIHNTKLLNKNTSNKYLKSIKNEICKNEQIIKNLEKLID